MKKAMNKEKNMRAYCSITVADTKVFPELQGSRLDPRKAGACPRFSKGEWISLDRMPTQEELDKEMMRKYGKTFCPFAWEAISRYVRALFDGASLPETGCDGENGPFRLACCGSGTRPVIFEIRKHYFPKTEEEYYLLKDSE